MTKEEKERRYYNKKLIKDGFQNEMKKPLPIDIKDLIARILGCGLGLWLCDLIGTETLIRNNVMRFVVDVLIVSAMLAAAEAVFRLLSRAMKKN
ncbi:MAG TPA: hypothetical protein DCG49_00610 [Ruminococcus sp.]|nr:hypothetical protein [Ruminococcus sp.]